MIDAKRTYRPIGPIDIAASALARIAPRLLTPFIDQARLDATSLATGLTGGREPSFAGGQVAVVVPRPLDEIDPLEASLPKGLARHYVTFKRDLASIARDLRGERRPLVARPASPASSKSSQKASLRAAPPLAPSSARWRVRVVEVVRETADAVSLVLEDARGAPIRFEAGQFLTLHLPLERGELRRAYSISSTPLDGARATITVKRIEGGRGSGWIHANARAGMELDVLGPSGSFVLGEREQTRHVVLLAGGSGITPCMSIARTVLRTEPDAKVTLVYGNRSEADVIFARALDTLAQEHGSRFTVLHVMSEPQHAASACAIGLLDRPTLARVLDTHAVLAPESEVFVCGPTPMMDAARDELRARGVSRLREERFVSAPDATMARSLPAAPQLVSVKRKGVLRDVWVKPEQTLLEAATGAGVPMPFSCAMGGCGACKVQLVEGQVHMDEPNCLSPHEVARGAVLACVGHPMGRVRIEVPG